eukprot:2884389-Pyramimonas_sp.AAC.1
MAGTVTAGARATAGEGGEGGTRGPATMSPGPPSSSIALRLDGDRLGRLGRRETRMRRACVERAARSEAGLPGA